MTFSHLDAVMEIEERSFTLPWSRSLFREEMDTEGGESYVIPHPDGPGIIAYLCVRRVLDEAQILRIAVAPAWRGGGVAGRLVRSWLDDAGRRNISRVFLEVRPSNTAAIALYRSLGFTGVGRRPRYYPETGEDAIVMMRNLTKEEA